MSPRKRPDGSLGTGDVPKFFYWYTLYTVGNKAIIKYPTTSWLRRCTTL